MASKTAICNMAISHLAKGKEIADIATEKSEEASACRRFYDIAVDQVLRDFPWPFSTKIVALALIEENPTPEWSYAYRYPTDCHTVHKIFSGIRNDNRQTRVPYKIHRDDSGLRLLTDMEDARIEYTAKEIDPEIFPPDFTLALSFMIAFLVAPRLTSGDPFKLGDRAYRSYEMNLSTAKATAANEEQMEEEPDSEYIRERE